MRLHGPMYKALVYGTRDSGFDPQWSRVFLRKKLISLEDFEKERTRSNNLYSFQSLDITS